jgi:hypothetical protein
LDWLRHPYGGRRQHHVLFRLPYVGEARDAEWQAFRLLEDRLVTDMKVEMRNCRIAAVSKVTEYIATMNVLTRVNAHASGEQVCIMCENVRRYLEHDEIAV